MKDLREFIKEGMNINESVKGTKANHKYVISCNSNYNGEYTYMLTCNKEGLEALRPEIESMKIDPFVKDEYVLGYRNMKDMIDKAEKNAKGDWFRLQLVFTFDEDRNPAPYYQIMSEKTEDAMINSMESEDCAESGKFFGRNRYFNEITVKEFTDICWKRDEAVWNEE